MKYITIILLLTVFFVACNTSKKTTVNKEKIVAIENATTNTSNSIAKNENAIEEAKDVVATEQIITEASNELEETKKAVEKTTNAVTTKNIATKASHTVEKTKKEVKNKVEKVEESVTTTMQKPEESVVNTNKSITATPVVAKASFNHNLWNNLLQKNVSNKGNVNYKGFKNDQAKLNEYITSLSNNVPNATASKKDKLAYWINAYNALTVDLILRNYPIKSIKDIKNPWDQSLWSLGGKSYDLNEIEHGILRKMNEPRIHFAIVCTSFSCPKLSNEAFIANKLESQLTKATKDFLDDPARNSLSKDEIEISKIFKWFAKDFKTEGSIIDFINTYASITVDQNADSSFKDYNWSLNE